MPVNKLFIVALLLAALVIPFQAEAYRWHDRKDEGWFFYKDPPPEETPKPLKPEPAPAPPPITSPFHPAKNRALQIKELGEILMSEAIVNPTEENVKKYMVYQKRMMDGSHRFAQVWDRVLMSNPDLYLAEHHTEDVQDNITKSLEILAEKTGIFFFFTSNCPHSHRQVPTILELQRKYDFKVIAISVDGGIMPGLETITRPDNGISASIGIRTVPSLVLAYPSEDRFAPIGEGFMKTIDVERRLYNYAEMDPDINPFDILELLPTSYTDHR